MKTVRGVLRIWVTTASVMSYARVATLTCFLLKPSQIDNNFVSGAGQYRYVIDAFRFAML